MEDGGLLASTLPLLTELRLSRMQLGLGLVAEIVEHCPRLRRLGLHRCKHFDAAFAAALRVLCDLRSLTLSECPCAADELTLAQSVLPSEVAVYLVPRGGDYAPQHGVALEDTADTQLQESEDTWTEWLPDAVRADCAAAALWANEESPPPDNRAW